MSNLYQANNQWMNRPSDERFCSLIELHDAVSAMRRNSRATVVSSRQISLAPKDAKDLVAIGPDGNEVAVSNWSFGQLAQRAQAPAGYLRTLPNAMAADCINYGLQYKRDIEDVGVLLYKNGGGPLLRAVTGPNYGRIWNETITKSLVERFGDGIHGDFRVPGEFGREVTVTKDNTTLYASDRDMFVFLADEKHRIELPNRRNGQSGSLARGFFIWNSEVGDKTFGIGTFLFDYVCKNRIVWGAEGYQQVTIRHTSGAPDKWIEEAAPAIEAYANKSTHSVTQAIEDARSKRIDNVDEFLAKRFTRPQVSAIKAAHMNDEQRPIETLWDAATAVTAFARDVPFQGDRVDIEREGGKILAMATK